MNHQRHTSPHPARLVRRTLGFLFLGIGILGSLLPIIPGWPGLFVAILLLGRRDPTLRRLHLVGRRSLRTLRTSRVPHMRRVGRWLSDQYVGMRRIMRPKLIWAEKFFV
ncbi:hypothetical protein OSCT_0484 [Oscillochloris trichoides DG-6]|uniref:Transmembrane protein (PGPGW) n=1 Tax=Oscillochloris trichoides DG-6 TaxID=765420 RepID=E1IAY3_9CHLR|nr:hypothetical protein [Oscillochloris trichoides]EFO81629.1 hypothetical protein OSCT_0484 [Oscillochloris trichoides DG-6]